MARSSSLAASSRASVDNGSLAATGNRSARVGGGGSGCPIACPEKRNTLRGCWSFVVGGFEPGEGAFSGGGAHLSGRKPRLASSQLGEAGVEGEPVLVGQGDGA